MAAYTTEQLDLINQRYVQAGLPWTLTARGEPLVLALPLRVLLAPDPHCLPCVSICDRLQALLHAMGYPVPTVKAKHVGWAAGLPLPAQMTPVDLMARALQSEFKDMIGAAAAMKAPALRPLYLSALTPGPRGNSQPTALRRGALLALTPLAQPEDEALLVSLCRQQSTAVMVAALRALAKLGVLNHCVTRDGMRHNEKYEDVFHSALDIALHNKAEALDEILEAEVKDSVKVETLRLALDVLHQQLRSTAPPKKRIGPLSAAHSSFVQRAKVIARAFSECLLEHFPNSEDDEVSLIMSWCLGVCVKLLGDEVVEPILRMIQKSNPQETRTYLLLNILTRYQGPAHDAASIAAEVALIPDNDDNDMIHAKNRTVATLRRSPYAANPDAWLGESIDRFADLSDPTHAPPPWIGDLLSPPADPVAASRAAAAHVIMSNAGSRFCSEINGLSAASALAIDPSTAAALSHLILNGDARNEAREHSAAALLNCPSPLQLDPLLLRVSVGASIGGPIPMSPLRLGTLLGLTTIDHWSRTATKLLQRSAPHGQSDIIAGFFLGCHQGAPSKSSSENNKRIVLFGHQLPLPSLPDPLPHGLLALVSLPTMPTPLMQALAATPEPERADLSARLMAGLMCLAPLQPASSAEYSSACICARNPALWRDLSAEDAFSILTAHTRWKNDNFLILQAAFIQSLWPKLQGHPHVKHILQALTRMIKHKDDAVIAAAEATIAAHQIPVDRTTDRAHYNRIILELMQRPLNGKTALMQRLRTEDNPSSLKEFAFLSTWRRVPPPVILSIVTAMHKDQRWTHREFAARLLHHLPRPLPHALTTERNALCQALEQDHDNDVQEAARIASNLWRDAGAEEFDLEPGDLEILEAIAQEFGDKRAAKRSAKAPPAIPTTTPPPIKGSDDKPDNKPDDKPDDEPEFALFEEE